MKQPNFLTIDQAIREMRGGVLDPAQLQRACASQIERLDPRLHAFITVASGADAPAVEDFHAVPRPTGSLSGIPIAVKDLLDTAGIRTTAGSRFFTQNVPSVDAEAVRRLKAEGAFIIGKTNTHEIALGVTTLNPHFGACKNPWDENRIAGGSSGGSAVAIATGMALGALGTDTGGSIRIPASLCGVVGLKPSFGRVSLRGVLPLSWNLDHVGPLARTVPDAALLLQALAGYDVDDPVSAKRPLEDFVAGLEDGVRGWRVALGSGPYVEAADREVLHAVEAAALVIGAGGAHVDQVDVSFLLAAARANKVMTQVDASAVHRQRLADHPDWFGEDVRRRLEMGRDTPAAEYVLARRAQVEAKRRLESLFENYDVLVLPATPTTAPAATGRDAVELAGQLTRFTAPFNLTGMPAISVCCGFDGSGLPIGMQLISGPWMESTLLRAARAYEKSSDWSTHRPPLIS